ncbi:MAG: hypothetical protein PW734_09800 [Verrucomicrobium sp.]|nr:hypothetical protein [Verrucomicrobium sp.]
MVLIFEILLLGPLLTAAAVELTHRYPRSRYAWAFCLSSFAAWALGYAVDLCAAAADGRLEWDDGGFAIFNWLIVGLFVQGLGFFVSRNKWPLAAPYVVASAAYLILSFAVQPYHRTVAYVLLPFGGLLALMRTRGY